MSDGENEEDSIISISPDKDFFEKIGFSVSLLAVLFVLREIIKDSLFEILGFKLVDLFNINVVIFGITIYIYALYFVPIFSERRKRQTADFFYIISVIFPLLVISFSLLEKLLIWLFYSFIYISNILKYDWILLISELFSPVLLSFIVLTVDTVILVWAIRPSFRIISSKSDESVKSHYLEKEESLRKHYGYLKENKLPKAAVIDLVDILEIRLKEVLYKNNIPTKFKTLRVLAEISKNKGIIDEKDYSKIQKLIRFRNNLVHNFVTVSEEDAIEYIEIGESLLKKFIGYAIEYTATT